MDPSQFFNVHPKRIASPTVQSFHLSRMRSPHNAVSDLMIELGMDASVKHTVVNDPQNPLRWLITFESAPGALIHSRLHVEVIQGNPYAYACVLERMSVGLSVMTRIMNALMTHLEEEPHPDEDAPEEGGPPGGEPPG
jgi:hypothetical protein